MNTASTKIKALVAGGAAFTAFGLGVLLPAQADPVPSGPNGEIGQAWNKAQPQGQSTGDRNHGFTCDENSGVGDGGNPALHPVCGDGSQGGGGGDYEVHN